jgi:hypothetical protein
MRVRRNPSRARPASCSYLQNRFACQQNVALVKMVSLGHTAFHAADSFSSRLGRYLLLPANVQGASETAKKTC